MDHYLVKDGSRFKTYSGIHSQLVKENNIRTLLQNLRITDCKNTRKSALDVMPSIVREPDIYDSETVYEAVNSLSVSYILNHTSKRGDVPQFFIDAFEEIFPSVLPFQDRDLYYTRQYCIAVSSKHEKPLERSMAHKLEPDIEHVVKETLQKRYNGYKSDGVDLFLHFGIWTPERSDVHTKSTKNGTINVLSPSELGVLHAFLKDLGCDEAHYEGYLRYIWKRQETRR